MRGGFAPGRDVTESLQNNFQKGLTNRGKCGIIYTERKKKRGNYYEKNDL